MKGKLITFLLLLLASVGCQQITASVTLVQYQPFVFQLQFSEAVSQPAFQLLLNNLYPLNYTFLTTDLTSDTFFFQVDPFQYPSEQKLQNYQVVFSTPMRVGGGRLSPACFMLTASKVNIQINFSQTLGLLAVLAAYFMINFTVLGLALMEFMQVYCLLMFRNAVKTTLYHQISKDLLLLNPILTDGTYQSSSTLPAILLAPLIVVLLVGALGFVIKRWVQKTESIILKIVYQTFVYNLFVTVSTVFLFPLFYNSIQFYQMSKKGAFDPSSLIDKWGNFTSYLSLATTLGILYLFFYVINPKWGQSDSSWKKYLKTQQFHNFRKLHEMLVWDSWYKRNKNMVVILKRLFIGGLFFWDNGFQVMVFLLEFANIFYIFISRPFKYQIYMNTSVISRLLMFLFYGMVLLGDLYYSLGSVTVNYQPVANFLVARDVVFLVIILSMFLFIFYQIYNKCSNLNYQIRLVREENEFKLKITEKQKMEEETTRRLHLKSLGDSQEHSYHRNARFTTFETKISDNSPIKKPREGTFQKRISKNSHGSRKRDEEVKNSMPARLEVEGGERQRSPSYVTSDSKKSREKRQRKERHKWKKESLLAEILKDN